ncbi:RlpA-like double-psi beta-barrel-protein domain-containing protein-containing protein [Sordaria brevicollis]|uniref:RlpA-like double-psi beta-barrel-protein domain-containing protein-containing protein n=1 Tax=Sordaria brevicollis TaxID=83679 RepID=A0AAE0PIC7_SORBR|nr:RlpA-like double-psi beta-barrel-protein domain-containing protein-containing protein [Sordaria brevicollis]
MLFHTILTSTLSLFLLPLGTFAAPAPAPAPIPAPDAGLPIAIRSSPDDQSLNPRAFNSRITWFNTGLGACGFWSNDSQMVAALNAAQFDPSTPGGNPNRNTLCNRNIRVNANGRSVTVKVVDRCPSPSCGYGALDLSPAAFQALGASLGVGVLQGSWDWA